MSVFDIDNESLNSSPELSNCFENSLHRDSGVYFFFFSCCCSFAFCLQKICLGIKNIRD